jgi:gliding motility-associated lipoprotein GldH
MTGSRSRIIVAVMLMATAATGCNRGIQYSDIQKIEEGQWNMFDPAKYACTFDDTVMTYDIGLSLRTTTDYPYRNIYLFMVTTFPSGTTVTDTLHAMVTDEKGHWLGKGTGNIRELTVPFKSNVWFPEAGEYHFRVMHGMRDTVLQGVRDIGMKISRREGRAK